MLHNRREAVALLAGGTAGLLWAGRAQADVAAAPAAAGEAAATDPDARIGAGSDGFEHLTAPVMLNGQGPFAFLVDTGANVSCVSRAVAERLALPIEEAQPVHTMVGVRRAPMAVIDTLQVGDRRRRRVAAPALRIDAPNVDGILAVDWLKGQRLTLDFANAVLEFTASRQETSAVGRVIVPARKRLGQLTIVDADLGDKRVSAMIDSGSQVSLCNSSLLRMLDRRERAGAVATRRAPVKLLSILGEPFVGQMIELPFLRVGGLQLGNVPVVYTDTHVFEIWGLADRPAVLLGMDLLRQFQAVSLDFGRSHVRFDLAPATIASASVGEAS